MGIDKKLLEKLDAGREYRAIDLRAMTGTADEGGECRVEGYACTFDDPYLLYDFGDYKVYEQIDSRAFDNCDMSDVIFQYNHNGRVFARTRNETLTLSCDGHGLKVRAELGGTEIGRQLFEEIRGGYIDRMSFGFVVGKDERRVEEDYDSNTMTVWRTITEIKKLYDVSAVSFPANDDTEISARSFCEGVIAEAKEQERLAAIERQNRDKQREEIRRLLGKTN